MNGHAGGVVPDGPAPAFCTGCGREVARCPGCDRPLDPPRHCPACGRRMAVLVTPAGWRARCRDHGEVTPERRTPGQPPQGQG